MKPIWRWWLLVALPALLVTDASPVRSGSPGGEGERICPVADRRGASGSLRRVAAVVSGLQAAQNGTDALSPRAAGDVWIEVDHLKREGYRTRAMEWYASELEGSLRRGADDATARRHILNNLSYEVEAMRRRAQ